MNRRREGFTLIELLIVTVLGALVLAATLQVLVTNQRTYTAQNAKIQGQQSTRAALDVLSAELREISARDGDLISMSTDSLTIRTMRNFGIVCATTLPVFPFAPTLTLLRTGTDFENGDSLFVFADNNPSIATDDVWFAASVTAVDTTATCGTQEATKATFSGQNALFTSNVVGSGAPVRSFTRQTYRLTTYAGETYLGRRQAGSAIEPMVGPLKTSNGIQFVFQDSVGTVTTTSNKVRRIGITIRTASGVNNSIGGTVSDSVSTTIYTRN